MIGELYTPPMYRDLMSSGMMMPFEFDPEMMGMGSMYGGYGMGMYNTNYLGGVRLQPNLSHDTVHILKAKEKESNNSMLTFGKAALAFLALGVVTKFLKGKKPWYTGASKKISSFIPSRPVGNKTWYKPWSWFNKPATP